MGEYPEYTSHRTVRPCRRLQQRGKQFVHGCPYLPGDNRIQSGLIMLSLKTIWLFGVQQIIVLCRQPGMAEFLRLTSSSS
eukprot:3910071-Pyramimonas_sp.AAC.1